MKQKIISHFDSKGTTDRVKPGSFKGENRRTIIHDSIVIIFQASISIAQFNVKVNRMSGAIANNVVILKCAVLHIKVAANVQGGIGFEMPLETLQNVGGVIVNGVQQRVATKCVVVNASIRTVDQWMDFGVLQKDQTWIDALCQGRRQNEQGREKEK